MHQKQYAAKNIELQTCADFRDFRSLRHKMAWLGQTRPEVIAPVKNMSQVIERNFQVTHIIIINCIVNRVKTDDRIGIKQHKLDKVSSK